MNSKDDNGAPLWSFVEKKQKTGNKGGNRVWICNYCEKEFQETYTRIKGHLLHQAII